MEHKKLTEFSTIISVLFRRQYKTTPVLGKFSGWVLTYFETKNTQTRFKSEYVFFGKPFGPLKMLSQSEELGSNTFLMATRLLANLAIKYTV